MRIGASSAQSEFRGARPGPNLKGTPVTRHAGTGGAEPLGGRLSDIRRRVAAATPGSWASEGGDDNGYAVHARGVVIAKLHGSGAGKKRTAANAALIAHAPDDLLYLLGRIDEIEARASRLEDSVNRMCAERLLTD